MTSQLDKLLAQQVRATQKKHEAEHQGKRFKKQISDLKNKEHTHRPCTRVAYLEKLLPEPEALTDEEVFEILGYAFNTPYLPFQLTASSPVSLYYTESCIHGQKAE